jgi:hypothetical protein
MAFAVGGDDAGESGDGFGQVDGPGCRLAGGRPEPLGGSRKPLDGLRKPLDGAGTL